MKCLPLTYTLMAFSLLALKTCTRFYYCLIRTPLNVGIKELKTDSDVQDFVRVGYENKWFVDLYVEHFDYDVMDFINEEANGVLSGGSSDEYYSSDEIEKFDDSTGRYHHYQLSSPLPSLPATITTKHCLPTTITTNTASTTTTVVKSPTLPTIVTNHQPHPPPLTHSPPPTNDGGVSGGGVGWLWLAVVLVCGWGWWCGGGGWCGLCFATVVGRAGGNGGAL
nr:splicing factor [Tanacetum cinerariifolium]